MTIANPDPRLCIVVRTDMDSMNPGKGMAQAAHAANAFTKKAQYGTTLEESVAIAFSKWYQSTEQGFGTTIVLAASSEEELIEVITQAAELGFTADVIHDPTYPVSDGDVTHLIPVNTCGYVFIPEPARAPRLLTRLPLHP